MLTNEDQSIVQYLMGEDALLGSELSTEFDYITNPDGTIRWIYPKDMNDPLFLNFYSTSSLRAKILNNTIKLAFFLGQSHLVKSGSLNLQVSEESRLSIILKKYGYSGFSIFTGTVGENRKVLIEIHDDKKTFVFVKIALEESSRELVRNEIEKLQYLNNYDFNGLVIPKVIDCNDDGIVGLTNIKPNNHHQSSKFTQLHANALSELNAESHTQTKWSELSALQESKHKTEKLLGNYKVVNSLAKERVQRLCQNVLLLIGMIEKERETLPLSIAHGDFTPWNMYISNDTLYLFDWELSQRGMPMLVDLMHFVFQSEILIKHAKFTEIFAELGNVLKMQNIQKLIDDFDVDFNKHYMFYLVYTISYCLNIYVKQQQLHEQVFWLINSWEDAVADLLNKKGVVFR